MQLKYLDTVLAVRNLKAPSLEALNPDSRLYEILLLQIQGDIEANISFIGNREQQLAFRKYESFLDLASQKNIDLVVTPEYSCPWSVIDHIISKGVFPNKQKLWVLGCESIGRDELRHFITTHSQVFWIYEDELVNNEGKVGNFFDPLLYIFKTEDTNGNEKIIFTLQFKTTHMSVHGSPLERDNYIPGNLIYILRNDESSIYLLTLICADSLGFRREQLTNKQQATLIMHIQMNPDPRGDNFKNYRNDLYANKEEKKEILCLNWAKSTNIANVYDIDFAGSAHYVKTKEVDRRDEKINYNHEKGLYFTNWKSKKVNSYFFNSDEYVFHYRSTKVLQDLGTPEQQKRTGPEMIETFIWDENKWAGDIIPNDGFLDLLKDTNLTDTVLNDLTYIDKERLIALSSGEALMTDWHKPEILKFLIIDDQEKINKITVTQDGKGEVQKERLQYLSLFSALMNDIILCEDNFPGCIKDLVNGCSIGYVVPNFNHNLYSLNGNPPATVAYVGSTHEKLAKKIFDAMFSFLDEDSRRRLVVWFDKDRKLNIICSPPPEHDADLSEDIRSITRGA
ncbi:hypothetical protein REC12_23440 [Desulfosporosinus sp. PR]|uniref:hypothetical protein n=1 Tax=Candidatus Desulfosporosinus nitrosoreducens TaxID=3401928 RepID=UPI0027E95EB2|nr:hypothetical protein [Desulfosporosinus sp. PR]MDQ7096553.1 hypothetical protein [Desulfosporosinus sp. PR]